jgi:hypothetical protein
MFVVVAAALVVLLLYLKTQTLVCASKEYSELHLSDPFPLNWLHTSDRITFCKTFKR